MNCQPPNQDAALQPPLIDFAPSAQYGRATRRWQGIPGIESDANGKLWATWYSGGADEGPDNYVLLVNSKDGGESWSEPLLVIDPAGAVRAFDPVLWRDPRDRLWLFWAQSDGKFDGRAGVWAISKPETGGEDSWTVPRRLCDGVMMNKPLVLSSGEWLLPVAQWSHLVDSHPSVPASERLSHVYASVDEGQSWALRGSADVPDRTFDEHMLVERGDRSLWMLVRTREGIGESVSTDGGFSWTDGCPTQWAHPDSRFFIRRLASGRLLLVKHHNFVGRSHLTAFLSGDDGETWGDGLLLDARADVSYPDGTQAGDGRITIIYDRERYGARQILLAAITEADILAGSLVDQESRLAVVVDG